MATPPESCESCESKNELEMIKLEDRIEYRKNGKLHREGDLPAVIRNDGIWGWYIDGKRHREGDLPSYVNPKGTKIWEKHGERHREGDLPAYSGPDGESWYKHGKLHRDNDLPAFVGQDGTKIWEQHGLRHREGDLPAYVGQDGESWWKHGKRHRDNDLPAIIGDGGNKWYKDGVEYIPVVRPTEESTTPKVEGSTMVKLEDKIVYKKNDKLHREGDLPAVIHFNGTLEWYVDGQRHRDGDEPAYIGENGDKAWWKHGKWHRDNDLPALIYANGEKQWRMNGVKHRDNDLPAWIKSNGATGPCDPQGSGDQYWYQHGKLHREGDLPAFIGSKGERNWWINGLRHRDNDLPAHIGSNGDQEWWINGNRHRDNDLPSYIGSSGDQVWYQNGQCHRDNDLPAYIGANGYQAWYQKGKRHRDNDLPAIIDKGKEIWYKNGMEYTPNFKLQVVELTREIEMLKLTSSFYKPQIDKRGDYWNSKLPTDKFMQVLSNVKYAITVASQNNGRVFGGFVRNVIVPEYHGKPIHGYKDVDLWFTKQEDADKFVADMASRVTLEVDLSLLNNQNDDSIPYNLAFTRTQYMLKMGAIDEGDCIIDVVVSKTIPVNDFNVNLLTYSTTQGFKSYANQSTESLINDVLNKEARAFFTWNSNNYTKEQWKKQLNRLYRMESLGWEINY